MNHCSESTSANHVASCVQSQTGLTCKSYDMSSDVQLNLVNRACNGHLVDTEDP